MKKIRKIGIIFLLISICFIVSGCKKDDKVEKEELRKKTISELGYVQIKIIDMLNVLNNITFDNYTIAMEQVQLEDKSKNEESKMEEKSSSENEEENSDESSQGGEESNQQNNKQENSNQDLINTTRMQPDTILMKNREDIDWNIIKPEIELLNESWSVIILDLYSLNVDGGTILDFSAKLNNSIIAIKNEDKQECLRTLADLYSSIPIFLNKINADENLQNIRQTQSYVINAYSLADNITNPEINTNIQSAIDIYSKVISNIDYIKDKTFKTNKVYVLLNELANCVQQEDSELFYIKYKNFMEAINEI